MFLATGNNNLLIIFGSRVLGHQQGRPNSGEGCAVPSLQRGAVVSGQASHAVMHAVPRETRLAFQSVAGFLEGSWKK